MIREILPQAFILKLYIKIVYYLLSSVLLSIFYYIQSIAF